MIAALAFEPSLGRLRRARFVPRVGVPLGAACVVANGLRDALQSVLGDTCAVTLGEPVAIAAEGWRSIASRALAFVLPGRATDLVFVLPRADARALIAAAFGEEPIATDASWTALEAGAVERIVARAAPACEALCGERRGALRAVDPLGLDPCVDFFDVRVAAPVRLTIGVGTLRPLAVPPPALTLAPGRLGALPLDLRVVLGRGLVTMGSLLALRAGDVVRLESQVAGEAELNVASQRIALGTCGVVNGRAAFAVDSIG